MGQLAKNLGDYGSETAQADTAATAYKGSPKSGSGNSMFSASSKGSFSDLKFQRNFKSMSRSDVMVSTEFLSTTGSKSNSSDFTVNQVILSYKEVGSNGNLLEGKMYTVRIRSTRCRCQMSIIMPMNRMAMI